MFSAQLGVVLVVTLVQAYKSKNNSSSDNNNNNINSNAAAVGGMLPTAMMQWLGLQPILPPCAPPSWSQQLGFSAMPGSEGECAVVVVDGEGQGGG